MAEAPFSLRQAAKDIYNGVVSGAGDGLAYGYRVSAESIQAGATAVKNSMKYKHEWINIRQPGAIQKKKKNKSSQVKPEIEQDEKMNQITSESDDDKVNM